MAYKYIILHIYMVLYGFFCGFSCWIYSILTEMKINLPDCSEIYEGLIGLY